MSNNVQNPITKQSTITISLMVILVVGTYYIGSTYSAIKTRLDYVEKELIEIKYILNNNYYEKENSKAKAKDYASFTSYYKKGKEYNAKEKDSEKGNAKEKGSSEKEKISWKMENISY